MPALQIIFGCLLVAILLGLAGFYCWRQVRVLRQPADVSSDEIAYRRRQAKLRLAGSALIGVLALQLAGALLFLEAPAQQLADRGVDAAEDPAHRDFVNFYAGYWIAFLLVLFLVLVLASADFWFTRRFAQAQYRRLQADRRAMVERQAELLRAARRANGAAETQIDGLD